MEKMTILKTHQKINENVKTKDWSEMVVVNMFRIGDICVLFARFGLLQRVTTTEGHMDLQIHTSLRGSSG